MTEKTYRTKAEIGRNTRHAAKISRSRSKVYRRMKKWEEEDVGLDTERHVIALVEQWSFSPREIVREKTFGSVSDAMRGISKTYPCSEIEKGATLREELAALRRTLKRSQKELEKTKKELERAEEELAETEELKEEVYFCRYDLQWCNEELEKTKRRSLSERLEMLAAFAIKGGGDA